MNPTGAKMSVYLYNDVVTTTFVTGAVAQKTIIIGDDLDLGDRLSARSAGFKRESFRGPRRRLTLEGSRRRSVDHVCGRGFW